MDDAKCQPIRVRTYPRFTIGQAIEEAESGLSQTCHLLGTGYGEDNRWGEHARRGQHALGTLLLGVCSAGLRAGTPNTKALMSHGIYFHLFLILPFRVI